MERYKLIVVGADECLTGEFDNIVKGFAAAEERAKQLLDEYLPDYPDTYIACFEKGESTFAFDFPIFIQDCLGDRDWQMMVMGNYCPLCTRPLTETEILRFNMLRNERGRHLSDLDEEELKKLRTEICVGSLYLSDYKNQFNVDEKEVCDISDAYDYYLCTDEDGKPLPESEWKKDTPEEFAYFCMNFL